MKNPHILYENRLLDSAPVASTTAAGFSVLNLRDWRPYTWWKPTALPATVTVEATIVPDTTSDLLLENGFFLLLENGFKLLIDNKTKASDYALIWGHDLFTHGATIEIRGSMDNFVGSDVLVATRTPANNLPFMLIFASVYYRYWRVRITGSTMPSIAIASIGAALIMPTQLEYGFDPISRKTIGKSNRSEGGHPLGKSIDFEEWSASLTFTHVLQSFVRATFLPAWKVHLRSTPFVWAWDPEDNPTEIYLVQSGDNLSMPHDLPDRATLTFDVKGLAL